MLLKLPYQKKFQKKFLEVLLSLHKPSHAKTPLSITTIGTSCNYLVAVLWNFAVVAPAFVCRSEGRKIGCTYSLSADVYEQGNLLSINKMCDTET
jgi:hypothetical protein